MRCSILSVLKQHVRYITLLSTGQEGSPATKPKQAAATGNNPDAEALRLDSQESWN